MILRVCVVVPTFDNPRTISCVAKDIVKSTPFPVLIVDDGSETPVTSVLYSYEVREALEEGRVRVVRFAKNRGKGAALQFAIQDLIARGFTHMLTLHGDGQHLASEIPKLIEVGKSNPWDLIIGNRSNISKFRPKLASYWVAYQTGLQIQDSRSGFRLYPLFPLQTMNFKTVKYDFEIEVLVRFLWRGVNVRETEIQYLQQNGINRVSHFHKFRDGARICLLNIALSIFSVLHSHRTPKSLSLALGLGIFIGCTPFYGLHTVMIAAMALLLRLNVVAAFIGSLISLPLFVPHLVDGSVAIGKNLLKISEGNGMAAHLNQWMAGSFVLGASVGLVAGLLVFAMFSVWRRRSRRGLLSKGFRGLNEYYQIIQPKRSWWARQKLVIRHLLRFGQIHMDRDHQAHRGGQQFERTGRGLIVLGAHLGKVHEEMEPSAIKATFDIHQALKRGECIELRIDRSIGDRLELIPFLGKLAPFDVTIYRLAADLRIPILMKCEFKNEKGYALFSRGPHEYNFDPNRSREDQLYQWALEYVCELEGLVRKYPDQWFNLYPFWSTLPTKRHNLRQEFNVQPTPPMDRQPSPRQTGAPRL